MPLTGDFDKDIETAYTYFQRELNNRQKRPSLFDKQVFIEAHEQIDGCPQGFWHIISLEEKHRFEILPCVNDQNISLCSQNCTNSHHTENGKQSGKLYLRYNHAGADYILIFSAEKHFYRLISAYPVFYSRDKARFEKDAEKYCWSYFERK